MTHHKLNLVQECSLLDSVLNKQTNKKNRHKKNKETTTKTQRSKVQQCVGLNFVYHTQWDTMCSESNGQMHMIIYRLQVHNK